MTRKLKPVINLNKTISPMRSHQILSKYRISLNEIRISTYLPSSTIFGIL